MVTFGQVVLSIMIGVGLSMIMVIANYIGMMKYRDEYREWWTPKRYIILFVVTSITFTLLVLFGYYGNIQ